MFHPTLGVSLPALRRMHHSRTLHFHVQGTDSAEVEEDNNNESKGTQ
jgi:hypothetical protein